MNNDPASLANLRDIVQPPRVGWWPLAPGWWIVLTALAIVVVMLAVKRWQRWRDNAYRRAALRELGLATSASEVNDVLKRAALAAYPREDVAARSGASWCEWLTSTGGHPMPDAVANALTRGVFGGESMNDGGLVTSFAKQWIQDHPEATKQDAD